MRKKLYELISSTVYGVFMVACIIISLVPLAFRTEIAAFRVVEIVSTCVFVFDYGARWITADMESHDARHPFALYPLRPMPVIDLVSLLPSVTALGPGLRLLKIFRLLRTLRVFRAFKLARYSRNIHIIVNVFKAQKESLLTVLILAAAYILVSALVVFNVEPDTFANFFEAVYWATVSLTTMGYGDIYPVTTIGRTVTILSSLLGIAIVALPAGIVTAGYMDELKKEREENGKEKENTDLAQAETDDKSEEEIC
jgi:voltage-gated potassium channel